MNIWIFNHYATNMFFDKAGRHHSIAKYLVRKGNNVSIFCANTIHGRNETVNLGKEKYKVKEGADGVSYIFIKTCQYQGNGISRLKNMYQYYRNIFKVAENMANKNSKPDIIIASSVHPLALVAGIKIAKKMKIPCICEVRDLWPESLIAFDIIKKGSLISKALYQGEKWIYKRADQLIFTMPGGEKYILDKHWDDCVKLDKINHVNNGVDLEKFNQDKIKFRIKDSDLEDESVFKIIYAGSIRTANMIDDLVNLAEKLQAFGKDNIKLIIFGDGDQRERLEKESISLGLSNIVFKGRVEKQYVPYIISNGDLNIGISQNNILGQYGISWNKMFEYMASGKPVLINYDMGEYNLVDDYNFGIAKRYKNIEEFCKDVILMAELPENTYCEYEKNAKIAAELYDYKNLSEDIEIIIKKTIKEYDLKKQEDIW